jgi:hypothetical protein
MATGKSGSFELTGTNGITVQVAWSETYDVGNNTSVISIDSLKAKSSLYENVEYFPNGSISVDGTAVVSFKSSSGTHDVYIDNLNRYYDIDGSPAAPWKSAAVAHNTDGSKSVVIAVEIFFATLSGGNGHGAKISANKTIELTHIPRASTITEAAATTLGGYCAVKWTPLAASYRYRVRLSLGTWSMESGVLSPGSTSAYTYRAVVPLDVANQLPNDPSGTMTVSLRTYSDSSGANQVGNEDTETFTVTVPNNSNTQPVPGMTIQPISTLPAKFAGLYIQGKTKVDANFSGSGKYKATVKSYKMSVEGKTYSSPYTSGYLSKSGNVEVVGTATDSRGYPGTQTTKIYVIPYSDPKIQVSICGRCDASGNLSDSGTQMRIKATRSYSKVVDESGASHNTCGIQYRYAQAGGNYGNWVTLLTNGSTSDTADSGAIAGVTLAADLSYLVQIRAMDDIGGEVITTISLPTEKVFMHRNGPKNSVGFGGYENDPNTVSIAEDMTFKVKGSVAGITAAMVGAAPAGYGLGGAGAWVEDLNNATANGFYSWTDTAANKPFNYGNLLVLRRGGDRTTQIGIDPYMSGYGQIAVRHGNSNGWYDWMYLNPPMDIGVEYKTIERFNRKMVYVKAVEFGSLPSSGSTSVAFGTGLNVVSIEGVAYNNKYVCALGNYNKIDEVWYQASDGKIYISVTGSSDYKVTLVVKYTKE